MPFQMLNTASPFILVALCLFEEGAVSVSVMSSDVDSHLMLIIGLTPWHATPARPELKTQAAS